LKQTTTSINDVKVMLWKDSNVHLLQRYS